MYDGETLFTQTMDFLPWEDFHLQDRAQHGRTKKRGLPPPPKFSDRNSQRRSASIGTEAPIGFGRRVRNPLCT